MEGGAGAHKEGALTLGVCGLEHPHPLREALRVTAGRGQPEVGGDQVVDVSGELDPGGDQGDQVVADPLQVGDQVRGEDDGGAVLGDVFHEPLEELASGQRVQGGDGFVQDQQFRALGDGERQRDLGPLTA